MPKYLLIFPLLLVAAICFIPGAPLYILGGCIGCLVLHAVWGEVPENILGNTRALKWASAFGVLALISIALGNDNQKKILTTLKACSLI